VLVGVLELVRFGTCGAAEDELGAESRIRLQQSVTATRERKTFLSKVSFSVKVCRKQTQIFPKKYG
jgi:hypothetical protein